MVFNIQPHEKEIFDIVAAAARRINVPAYVVGGYVRDRLLDRPTKDIDIVCVGDGIKLAHSVASMMMALIIPVVFLFIYFAGTWAELVTFTPAYFIGGIITSLIVAFSLRGNFVRLFRGEERIVGLRARNKNNPGNAPSGD